MKTKISFFLILIPCFSFGQEWSPIGAQWYYDITYAFAPTIDYHRVYCDSVVRIDNIECKKINIDYSACNNHFSNKLYTYDRNDTVFFYNPDIKAFEILYDFNSQQGDYWFISTRYGEDIDTVKIQVDSVGAFEINDKILKRLFITYNYKNFMGSGYSYKESSSTLQVLGDMEFLINITDRRIALCDMDFISDLRCYSDSNLGSYTTGLRDSCNYRYTGNSVNSNQKLNDINVFPNPFKDKFQISTSSYEGIQFELFSSTGRMIKAGIETEIDMTLFPDGIYFLKLETGLNHFKTFKLIKQW
ncbi:MAG: T9SS type A sorting domain-containing protein [Bacteroidales bacterium]|nr:T9SS type A sorting domain-containing protein [Bacteroidales bacterium]MCB9012577.1 T9SS type A sorting domain-containing protein [Bacteroidales bacterium]